MAQIFHQSSNTRQSRRRRPKRVQKRAITTKLQHPLQHGDPSEHQVTSRVGQGGPE
jgi:hypothetical protein